MLIHSIQFLHFMTIPTIEYLNSRLVPRGYSPIKLQTYKKIMKFFFDGKRFNFYRFYAFKDALEFYGDRLFTLRFKCESCGVKKPFTEFRFSTKLGQFFGSCRAPSCYVKDDNAFRQWKSRQKITKVNVLTFPIYKSQKLKFTTWHGKLNSYRSSAIAFRIKIFGPIVQTSTRVCRICESRKKLIYFGLNKSKKGLYSINRTCLDCEAKIQRLKRMESRMNKKKIPRKKV